MTSGQLRHEDYDWPQNLDPPPARLEGCRKGSEIGEMLNSEGAKGMWGIPLRSMNQ